MTDETPVEQTEDVVEEVVEEVVEPKKPGRPKGSKNKKAKKKKAKAKVSETVAPQGVTPEQFNEVVSVLGALSEKLDKMEEAALAAPQPITARGPNAPTTNQRAMQELGYQTPGPARQRRTDAEINKERRDAIHKGREARGRIDRATMPSGVVASVGNKQRRETGDTRITNRPQ